MGNKVRNVRSHRLKLRHRWLRLILPLLAVLIGLFVYTFQIEPYWLDINPVSVTLPHLDPEFNGYRIAQLSDLHIDRQTSAPFMTKVIEAVNQQNPDLVALTGDFVTDTPQAFAEQLVTHLSKLQAPSVAVLGNHDHWSQPAVVLDVLRQSHIRPLNNDTLSIKRGLAQLQIAGVDDVWFQADNLEQVLSKLPPQGAAVLLVHEPDFADESAPTARFDLQLSGHSHGGQVAIPGVGPIILPPLGQRYPVGQYQIGTMIQYTNRGIGTVGPRARLCSRPEITIFTLRAPPATPS